MNNAPGMQTIRDWSGADWADLASAVTHLDTLAALARVPRAQDAPPASSTDSVQAGTVVVVWQPNNGARLHTFSLGLRDADPDTDLVGLTGPFAAALLGKAVGDNVLLPFLDEDTMEPLPPVEGTVMSIRIAVPRNPRQNGH